MNQKIGTGLGAIIIVIIALITGVIVWKYYQLNPIIETNNIIQKIGKKEPRACTMDAKLCPDGTYVSRSGSNCEFAACPENGDLKDKIIILSPKANQEISSPVSISGQARGGWFFEGSFPVEIYDNNKKLLGSGPVNFVQRNPTDTWMTENFIDFKGDIKFSQPATGRGYILFKKDNPSGNPAMDESLRLDVKFKPVVAADAWKNYKNEQYGFELTFPDTWKGFMATHRALDWGSDGTSDSIDFGFPEQKDGLFNISFHTKKQYNSISSSGAPFGQKLGEGNGYVFIWDQAQYAANADMEKRMKEVPGIIKTFQLKN